MRKITSFLFLMLVCCISAVAQDVVTTEKPVGKMIKVGTAQAEMVPNQWYFLYQKRGGDANAPYYSPGEDFTTGGGFAFTQGVNADGTGMELRKSTKEVAESMNVEAGVAYSKFSHFMVRFVPVANKEGVFNMQFANGNWVDGNLKSADEFTYAAGKAGEFNFYLIKEGVEDANEDEKIDEEEYNNGVENELGRFGWNKAPFANIVDNNGAGNNIVYWSEGKIINELEGNKIWNLFDILIVGDEDLYFAAFENLVEYHNSLGEGSLISSLQEGEVIGNDPGQYPEEPANELLEMYDVIGTMIDDLYTARDEDPNAVDPTYDTKEKMEQLLVDYKALVKAVEDSRIPRAMSNIVPGYYQIHSANVWTHTEPILFTEETAAEYNAEHELTEEDEDFKRAGDPTGETKELHPIKAIYSESNGNLRYATLDETKAEYLWKVEAVAGKPTEYRLINMLKNLTVFDIPTSNQVTLVENDTTTVSFDYRGETTNLLTQETTPMVGIRNTKYGEDSYNSLHANGWGGGTTKTNNIVGWISTPDAQASQWYLAPVSEEDANNIINAAAPGLKLAAMIAKADSILNVAPAQIEIAMDKSAACDTTANVANADVFTSPYNETEEGSIEGGFDDDPSTFWHSKWSSGDNGFAKNTNNGTNFFVINDVDGLINGGLAAVITRRDNANNDHVTKMVVYGTDDYDPDYDLETILDGGEATGEWTELGELKLPFGAKGETVTSSAIEFEGQYAYYKFLCTETYGTQAGGSNRGYFHFAEFKLYPATISQKYEVTQYQARQTEADALIAAMQAWADAEYSADSLELLDDADFNAAYANLLATSEAWAAVYTNPEALRAAIAGAPDDKLFVVGDKPGQWANGVETPATIVAEAQAYDESGLYTPAQSEAYIKQIEESIDDVYSKANKVKTDMWYRFHFGTEELYEEFGWDMVGAEADAVKDADEDEIQTANPLFGKFVAVGDIEKDYIPYLRLNADEEEVEDTATYIASVKYDIEDKGIVEGTHLQFFEDGEDEFDKGEELFRFIAVNDSAYMIQNKATGLFIRGGYPVYLSATPSLFQVSAMGAGACKIRIKNVLDKEDAGYNYLHAERSTNRLTSWDSENLGSNTMLFLEPIANVNENELPATEYEKKLWPGDFYPMTLPVSVSITEGATAYGAQLVIAEDTTVVLKKFEADVIEAGTPFVMVTDCNEYVSYDDSWDALEAANPSSDFESGTHGQYDFISEQMDAKHVRVKMNHGMEIGTEVTTTLDMRGTIAGGDTIKIGKAIVFEQNKVKHTLEQFIASPYSAWIACDFERGLELLNTIKIEVSGSIDTGIEETLDKVTKGGNIYTVGGQLVGKGNVNTIDKLPAGIYIVNGVKVIKN